MRRNAWYLIGYLAGWALAEWSLHKLTAPARFDPADFVEVSRPEAADPAHADPDAPCGIPGCDQTVCKMAAYAAAEPAGGDDG